MVAVAQLVRALVCGAGSRGFESHQPPQKKELMNSTLFFILIAQGFLKVVVLI